MFVYSCATPIRLAPCEAWAAAHGWELDASEYPFYRGGDAAVWGLIRGAKLVKQAVKVSKATYYALDNAYLRRNHYYRVTRNGFQHTQVVERPSDRWKTLGLEVKPWRKDGRKILVCESSKHCFGYLESPHWTLDIVGRLREITQRPVEIRPKVMHGVISPRELRNVWAVVTHVSACAVDALLYGVPVFVTGPGAALPLSGRLEDIERPVYPDRTPFFRSLAYAQFSVNEIRRGVAKQILDDTPIEWEHL